MSTLTKTLLTVAGVSLLLNVVWENLQAPLYQGYNNFWQHFPICFAASLGDVLVIVILYFLLAAVKKDVFWITKMNKVDVTVLLILGAIVAVAVEKWAIGIGRWEYLSAMPLIPYLKVGLLPVIQMMLLPILTFYFTKKLYDTR